MYGKQHINMCFAMTKIKSCLVLFICSELFSCPLPTPCIGIKVTVLSLIEYTYLNFTAYEFLV